MEKDLDPHKNAVYEWEDSWPGWNYNSIGIKACRTLIRRACKWHKVKPPTIVHHNVRSMSFAIPTKNYISLQGGEHKERGGRNVPTALPATIGAPGVMANFAAGITTSKTHCSKCPRDISNSSKCLRRGWHIRTRIRSNSYNHPYFKYTPYA